MRFILAICLTTFAFTALNAQFKTDEEELMIMVSDGTDVGKHTNPPLPKEYTEKSRTAKSAAAAPNVEPVLNAPIRSLGMTDCIQAAVFLKRPELGISGFMLIFTINDSVAGKQAALTMPDGKTYQGVYRLVRQKVDPSEPIPTGMTTYQVEGTFFLLGVS